MWWSTSVIFLISETVSLLYLTRRSLYSECNHRLYWLNIIAGNIKNTIAGIYHGVRKMDLPLFFAEQEYRFNHRNIGNEVMLKVQEYISLSHTITRKQISFALDTAFPMFSNEWIRWSVIFKAQSQFLLI